MAQFDPYYMMARRLAKEKFDRRDLTTITSFMVEDIERLLGPRLTDQAYEFTGIYFGSSHPQMEYRQDKGKHLTRIRLASGSTKDPADAIWQLAHECVHLITPHMGRTTILEEGIACWYQERWVDKIPQVFPEWIKTRRAAGHFPSYDEAYDLTCKLMSQDQNVMKRLRESQPVISKISVKLLKKEAPWLSQEQVNRLASKFERGRPSRKPINQIKATPKPMAAPMEPPLQKASLPLPVPTVAETRPVEVISFDPRASEIFRQAARLYAGMSLKPDKLAQFNISNEEISAAFQQIQAQVGAKV